MSSMASQITSLTIIYSTVYSGTDQRKHQSSALLAFVRGIHRGPVNFPAQMASNAENVSIWWRHHVMRERSKEHRSRSGGEGCYKIGYTPPPPPHTHTHIHTNPFPILNSNFAKSPLLDFSWPIVLEFYKENGSTISPWLGRCEISRGQNFNLQLGWVSQRYCCSLPLRASRRKTKQNKQNSGHLLLWLSSELLFDAQVSLLHVVSMYLMFVPEAIKISYFGV